MMPRHGQGLVKIIQVLEVPMLGIVQEVLGEVTDGNWCDGLV
jgi:hypothetical protein